MKIWILFMILHTVIYAQTIEHHEHVGTTALKLSYETLTFKGSKQKNNGKRQSIEIDHHRLKHHIQAYIEHTDTQTKPHIVKDLSVDKISFKYQYAINKIQSISVSHIRIDDTLQHEVDNGKVYGLGYRYKSLSLTQYFSNYKKFDVYQTDIKIVRKKNFSEFSISAALLGKYIHLNDRKSNHFSKKAKEDYLTIGVKLHGHYKDWHVSTGIYSGERIFAVMNDGLKVQHHAMAFKKTVMLSIHKKFSKIATTLRYIKQYATEVPIDNSGVHINNISLGLEYTF